MTRSNPAQATWLHQVSSRLFRRPRPKLIKTMSALAAVVTIVLPAVSHAAVIRSGETLRVNFSIPGVPAVTSQGEIDALTFTLDAIRTNSIIGAPSARFELFDGSQLLGSYEFAFSSPFTGFAFTSSSSLYSFRSTVVSDFSSILDGTIDGRIDITNTTKRAFDFQPEDPAFNFNVGGGALGRAFSSNGLVLAPSGVRNVVIESQERVVSVPEPSSTVLLVGAMLTLLVLRRRASPISRKCMT